jgi:hypothetical protein
VLRKANETNEYTNVNVRTERSEAKEANELNDLDILRAYLLITLQVIGSLRAGDSLFGILRPEFVAARASVLTMTVSLTP